MCNLLSQLGSYVRKKIIKHLRGCLVVFLFFLLWNYWCLLIWCVTFLIKDGLVAISQPLITASYSTSCWVLKSLQVSSDGLCPWANIFNHQLMEGHLSCTQRGPSFNP